MLEAARKGKEADADAAEKSITDPVARKLAEWIILRSDNTKPSFQRYATFVDANPSWPQSPLFRRRAENALWNDKLDDSAVRAFFANQKPTTAKGRYVLARALLAQGDRAGAPALVRHAWRDDDGSAEVEKKVLGLFGDMLTRADHKTRMDKRFYATTSRPACARPNGSAATISLIARARAAVITKARQCQGAARRGAGRRARRRRLYLRARADGCAKTTSRQKPAS